MLLYSPNKCSKVVSPRSGHLRINSSLPRLGIEDKIARRLDGALKTGKFDAQLRI